MKSEGFTLSDGLATGLPEDLVAEVAAILDWYGCDMGTLTRDAAARAILAARSWQERRAAQEREHARRHEEASRETRTILDLAEARRRARAAVVAGADAATLATAVVTALARGSRQS